MTHWDFNGKVVWVTGAGRGIGLAIANLFHNANATVLGLDKTFSCDEYPFTTVEINLADDQATSKLVESELLKNYKVDILICAAGVLHANSLETTTIEQWQQTLAVNVTAPFNLFRLLSPVFKEQRGGCVVSIASNAGHIPRTKMAAYGASKAALISLTKTFGLELSPYGVRCNIVSPGSTDTSMLHQLWQDKSGLDLTIKGNPDEFKNGIPLQKIAAASDIAHTVAYLASNYANHITLQDWVVDGGATLGC